MWGKRSAACLLTVGTAYLFALGARLGVRVLIASTQAVYGPLAGRLSEDTPCQPASEYGAAKLAMEQAVDRLPQTLNVAQPGMVAMDDILAAADVPWVWRTAPDTVLPILDLNVSALGRITDVPTADPVALVEEARFTGWLA